MRERQQACKDDPGSTQRQEVVTVWGAEVPVSELGGLTSQLSWLPGLASRGSHSWGVWGRGVLSPEQIQSGRLPEIWHTSHCCPWDEGGPVFRLGCKTTASPLLCHPCWPSVVSHPTQGPCRNRLISGMSCLHTQPLESFAPKTSVFARLCPLVPGSFRFHRSAARPWANGHDSAPGIMDHKRASGPQLGTAAPRFPHSDYSGQVSVHSLGQDYQAMAPFSEITAILPWFKSSSPAFLSLLTRDISSFFLLTLSDQSPGRMLRSKLTLHLEAQHVNTPTCGYRESLKGHAERDAVLIFGKGSAVSTGGQWTSALSWLFALCISLWFECLMNGEKFNCMKWFLLEPERVHRPK